MASDKQRRKNARQARKSQRDPAQPFRHSDGDRRRRGLGQTVKQALETKRALQQLGMPPPEDSDGPRAG